MSPIVPHRRARRTNGKSVLEDRLARYIEREGLPRPARQYRFAAPARRWAMDFCWPELGIALEVEGGTFMLKSRHTSGVGMAEDCAKYNAATAMGFRLFRVTDRMVRSGEAEQLIKRVLTGPPITYTPPIWAPEVLDSLASKGSV